MNAQPLAADTPRAARAVIYLRVSTRDQAKRGGEAEGFSIPAQREACQRKAQALGAEVVHEFVDAGESARSANRPDLKRMLEFVKTDPVDYVIVHKVDRLARNRVDDVEINLALTAAGSQLVSCSENIDETPSGMLLHGIMSSIAEFYSRNLATEAKKGMRQKAKNGGTPGMAPFGYVNASQRTEEGREMRTVLVDPDRAKWVPWIFERYATGHWTVGMLHEELTSHGVRTLPRPHRPSAPLSKSHLASILKNRYYVGVVTFDGVEHQGKHEALISEDLFERCQRVRSGRVQAKEKPRVRTHYLKGSVFCGRCGEPLSFEITRNRQGAYYEYFYCLGRQVQKNGCDFVATRVQIIERLVEDHWSTIQLGDEMLRDIRQIVWDHFDRVLPARDRQRSDAEERLARLKRESDKLLQAYYADAIDVESLRTEQSRIAAAKAIVERTLSEAQVAIEQLSTAFEHCCTLLANAHEHYLANDDTGRRDLNQAVFRRIYVHDDEVVGSDFTPVFKRLLDDNLAASLEREVPKERSVKLDASNLILIKDQDTMPEADVHASGLIRAKARRAPKSVSLSRRERPQGILPWEKKNPGPTEDQGSNIALLVGVTGFESVSAP